MKLRPSELPLFFGAQPAPTVTGIAGPFNYEALNARYIRVDTNAAGVMCRGAWLWKPPFVFNSQVTTTPSGYTDSLPRFFLNYDDNSYHILFVRTKTSDGSKIVYETVSKDLAQTWKTPTSLFTGGFCTAVRKGTYGIIIRSALVGATIQATIERQYSYTQQAPFTFQSASVNIPISADTYNIDQLRDNSRIWIGHWKHAGDSSTSGWFSKDNGLNWTRYGWTGFPSGVNPTVAVGSGGTIFWAARNGHNIYGMRMNPYAGTPCEAPFIFNLPDGSTPVSIAADTFQIQQSAWGRWWVLTAVSWTGSEGPVMDWVSKDGGTTWSPISA